MARIKFRDIKLSPTNKIRLQQINGIISEYQKQGYVLTLRQLYYQLVSRDYIPNDSKEYAKLSKILKEGRMGGIVDWNAIEDRLRKPSTPSSWDSPEDILDGCIKQYALPRMRGQINYVEVFVEKDALSGVLKRVTQKYHIPISVNRGYSSASAVFDMFNRFKDGLKDAMENYQTGDPVPLMVALYLGDFDPSGKDMIRDIEERMMEFFIGSQFYGRIYDQYLDSEEYEGENFEQYFQTWFLTHFRIVPVALTEQQIKQYNPPRNPAKITDPRAKEFIKKYGQYSWEVDALRPDVLNSLLDAAILDYIDIEKYNEVLAEEKHDIERLKQLKAQL